MGRLLSLAAGTVLDVAPAAAVSVAAEAGFPAVGVWHDPATWTAHTTAEVGRRLADSGVVALDVEPVIFGRGEHHGTAVIDIAAALGARFVLVASGPAARHVVVKELATLSAYAAAAAPGLTLVLEFLPIFTIGSLATAIHVVHDVAAPNLGVLVDTLHLARSGAGPADLARHDARLFPYMQLADAPAVPADPSLAGLRDEALHGRLLPGHGALPLRGVLAALPGVPVSIELRSRVLTEQFPDPVERARAVLSATLAVLVDEN